jgi:hypothetical protein
VAAAIGYVVAAAAEYIFLYNFKHLRWQDGRKYLG